MNNISRAVKVVVVVGAVLAVVGLGAGDRAYELSQPVRLWCIHAELEFKAHVMGDAEAVMWHGFVHAAPGTVPVIVRLDDGRVVEIPVGPEYGAKTVGE